MKVVVLDLRNFAEEEKENLLKVLEEQRGAMSHEDAMMEFVLGKLQPQKRDEGIDCDIKRAIDLISKQLSQGGILLEGMLSNIVVDKTSGVCHKVCGEPNCDNCSDSLKVGAPFIISHIPALDCLTSKDGTFKTFITFDNLIILKEDEYELKINIKDSKLESIVSVLKHGYGFDVEYRKPITKVKKSELEKWCLDNGYGYMNHKGKTGHIYTYQIDEAGRFHSMRPISPEELRIEIVEG